MSRTVFFDAMDVIPDRADVFDHQKIPDEAEIPEHIERLLEEAEALFIQHAHPAGILSELEPKDFKEIFEGEGKNAEDAVVASIYPQADHLALFAATMGHEVSTQIEVLFAQNEFALGSMLDSVASQAADRTSTMLEKAFLDELRSREGNAEDRVVLGYSPGYCGWHITGQKKLFDHLGPEEIDIALNDSCLMTPLKSVSGVLIAAPREVHLFDVGFSYCASCQHHSCLPRLERLREAGGTDSPHD